MSSAKKKKGSSQPSAEETVASGGAQQEGPYSVHQETNAEHGDVDNTQGNVGEDGQEAKGEEKKEEEQDVPLNVGETGYILENTLFGKQHQEAKHADASSGGTGKHFNLGFPKKSIVEFEVWLFLSVSECRR